ncbi:probable secreted beta-glucosidase SIM1 isoform X4 [Cephus cinctus]|uniref:Probable secreted beta-glucosidase SIM1 isoform X4 n=1 Tax=Cephus cinctus TaxID=211228 RepID=A0AAJ7C4D0_CEPCN|nr:probable secreted beta-glucosidase SIM1 isoform X4 [Cephus cinctus]
MWLHGTIIRLSALIVIIVTRVQATANTSEVQTNTQANSSADATANDAINNDESDNPVTPVIEKDDTQRNSENLRDVIESAEASKPYADPRDNAAATESDPVTESLSTETSSSSVNKDLIKELKPDAAAAEESSSTSSPTTSGSSTTSLEQDGATGFGGPIYGNGFFPDFQFHNYGAASQFPRIHMAFPGTGPEVAPSNTGFWSGSSSQSSSNSDGGGSSHTSSFGITSRLGGSDQNNPGNGVKGVYSSTSLDIDSSGKGVYKVSAGKIR